MIRRCHLCGRRGLRSFDSVPATLLARSLPRVVSRAAGEVVYLDVCRSMLACDRRRGVRS